MTSRDSATIFPTSGFLSIEPAWENISYNFGNFSKVPLGIRNWESSWFIKKFKFKQKNILM